MQQFSISKTGLPRLSGNALVEYGVIFGMVTLLSMGGFRLFGGNLNQLLGNSQSKLAASDLQDYVNLRFNGGNIPQGARSSGGSYTPQAQLRIDPGTGLPTLGIVDTTSVNTNNTSVEGSMTNGTYQTLDASRQLDALLPTITDPAAKAWATQIAQLTHYMAGAEGDKTGIPELTVQSVDDPGIYGYASAMRDIYNYRNQLSALMNNPPGNVSTPIISKVNTLAADAWNGSQPFISEISPYIDAAGNLDIQALGRIANEPVVSSTTYEQVSSYSSLQNKVNAALNARPDNGTAQTTLQDAHELQNYDDTSSSP